MVRGRRREQDPGMAVATRARIRVSPDRMAGGVCAGLAEWLGIDPLVVRLVAVLLAFTPGIGLVAYLIAWWTLPLDRRPPSTPLAEQPHWRQALQRDERRTM